MIEVIPKIIASTFPKVSLSVLKIADNKINMNTLSSAIIFTIIGVS